MLTIEEFAEMNKGSKMYQFILDPDPNSLKLFLDYSKQLPEVKAKVERDFAILKQIRKAIMKNHEMKLGDFVKHKDGKLTRLSLIRPDYVQTTSYGQGSFFHNLSGYSDFSGGLNGRTLRSTLTPTNDLIEGDIWFPHNNELAYQCRTEGRAFFRVYQEN